VFSHLLAKKPTTQGGFSIGGINATGQIPSIHSGWGLTWIDVNTLKEVLTKASDYTNPGDQQELVFSDKFNTEDRTFYPGDDPMNRHIINLLNLALESLGTRCQLPHLFFLFYH